MVKRRVILFGIFLVLMLNGFVQGYTYRGRVSTEDGICHLEEQGFGNVAVGELGYNDDVCEKVECKKGMFEAYGCGTSFYDKEKCREVPGSGHYPNCCAQVICDRKYK